MKILFLSSVKEENYETDRMKGQPQKRDKTKDKYKISDKIKHEGNETGTKKEKWYYVECIWCVSKQKS